jgi:uncharacterized membrane protein YbjE (DUF340 family)
MRFVGYVLTSLLLGIAIGHFYSPNFGNLYEIMLYVLILIIGIDLGLNFKPHELKRLGRRAFLLPAETMVGSLLGGLAASTLLGIGVKWGLAVAAGCGWYSLTGPLIGQYSAIYGALGFLANLTREVMTVIFYPLVSRRIPKEAAVTMGGATTMDTTLAVMTKFGGREITVVAFVHGFVLTAVVPFILPLILGL